MIEILKHGIVKPYVGKCSCGCQVRCVAEDVHTERNIAGLPTYVICPDCGNILYVEKQE